MELYTKEQAEKFLDTYLGGNRNVSTLTWDHWVECLQDYADRNAQIQIAKDRERVKANVRCKTEKEISTGELWPISEVDPKSIDETPIIID